MRALGANGTGDTLWLAIAVDGDLIEFDPYSFRLPQGLERAKALDAGVEELAAIIRRCDVDQVVLLEPEVTQATYQSLVPRMTVEITAEFAAAEARVPFVRLTRAKIRSKLGLPKSGAVNSYAGEVIAQPQSPHWKKERDLAAMAAVATSKDGA